MDTNYLIDTRSLLEEAGPRHWPQNCSTFIARSRELGGYLANAIG